jgi:Asp-tRNA(Asn)/Glu-tRNA(Gln) amidotransferase A subunit family amidase
MIGTAAPAPQTVAPPDDEICRLSATELVKLLRARELTAVELLDRVLTRADEVAEVVNPFSVRLDDAARGAAREADRLLDRGEGGPLTGLPVSVKDSQWLAGVESTYGSRARLGSVPQETLGAVERLVSAGAVIFAKTTVSEFCYFGISEAPLFGRTNNPHDVTRTAGGSSGGAAAHVAAYAGPVALGGDGGGSIRIPAAFCGLVGFKPTFGLVSHEPSAAGWKTLVSVGPLARTMADARLLLKAIAGHDRRDRHSAPRPEPPPEGPGRRLRVIASEDLGFVPVDDDVRRAFRRVVTGLTRAGVEVVAANPGLSSSAAAWATIACAEARWSEAAEYERCADLLSPEVRDYLAFGERISTQAYTQAQFERERIHRAYADMFTRTGADALLTPTLGCEAFPQDRRYPEAIGGVPIEPPWLDWSGFLYDGNLAGLPACAIPAGIGDDGLPVSVQVVGERWQDHVVLGAAETIESVLAAAPPTGPAGLERQET